MAPTIDRNHSVSMKAAKRLGYASLLLFGGTVGLWAGAGTIAGAVIGSAQFVTDGNLRKVQHQTGGVVADLLVREGDMVREGDVVIRLDQTIPRANHAILTRQIDELAARAARLEAERDQSRTLTPPPEFARRLDDPVVRQLMANEQRLIEARLSARDGMRSQLEKRIIQLRAEIEGYKQQSDAKQREAQMIQRELIGVRDLFRQNLVQITRLSQLEREAASLDGQKGQLAAAQAQSEGKIAEIQLQIIQLTEDLRAEVMRELREIQGRLGELAERRVAAEDQLKRVDIVAPVSGVVHQLAVHTVGGVISPAEPAMLIVPRDEQLQLEARVSPTDIDQLGVGQATVVRLHAFNQRTTPELKGTVSRIAADVTREQQTGLTYYVVRVAIPAGELQRIAPLQLVAGMQADVFIQTGERTPFSYLAKPVVDQFNRAFRER